ncbi:MAG: MFS transporter [Thermodesulfobacteriota bacterium]
MFHSHIVHFRELGLGRLVPLYMLIAIAFIGYSMMVTLFPPMLLLDNGFLDPATAKSTKTILIGTLLALYPLGQFLGSPVIGALSDRFGRKRVLLITLIFSISFYGLIAVALHMQSLVFLMIVCFLAGLSESHVSIVQGVIADSSMPEDRGRLFAYMYACMSVGYILGPLIGGPMAMHIGYSSPFWFVLVLLVTAAIWLKITLQESHISEEKEVDYFKTFKNFTTVFTDKPIRRIYLVNFILFLSILGFFRVIQIYMVDKWHLNVDKESFLYAYLAFACMIGNTFIIGLLTKKYTNKLIGVVCSIAGGLLMITIVMFNAEFSFYFTAGSSSVFQAIAVGACCALLSTRVSGDRQGSVMGNNQALFVGGEAIGAFMGGLLASLYIPLPILVFGILSVIAGLLLIMIKND